MKTAEEILAMSKQELVDYQATLKPLQENHYCVRCVDCVDCVRCVDCEYCEGCEDCVGCVGCVDCEGCVGCYMCKNAIGLKWAICNVEVGEEAYKKKMKELGITK